MGRELQEATRSRLQNLTHTSTGGKASLEPNQILNTAHRSVELLRQVRRVMWDYVGVVRTPSGLATALEALSEIQAEASELHSICPTLETLGVRDAVCAGQAVAVASASNSESAGAHYIIPDSEEYSDDEQDAVAAR